MWIREKEAKRDVAKPRQHLRSINIDLIFYKFYDKSSSSDQWVSTSFTLNQVSLLFHVQHTLLFHLRAEYFISNYQTSYSPCFVIISRED